MLPDTAFSNASLGELHSIWDDVVDDVESICSGTPEFVADQIAADFEQLRDEHHNAASAAPTNPASTSYWPRRDDAPPHPAQRNSPPDLD